MALSGTLNSSAYEGRYIQFTWTATQDVEKNQSVIKWTLKGAGTGVSGWYMAGGFKVVIDGATAYSVSTDDRITLYNGTTVASGSKTIKHNSDGTRTFKVSIQAGIYTYAVNCTGSTTFTLNTIPRASSFSVNNKSPEIGDTVEFTISPASTAFKHKLTLTWGGKTSDIGSNLTTSAFWAIPTTLAEDLPNSTSSGCIITCITYNGSTEIGRKTLSMTLKVSTELTPTISSITISEGVSGLASKFGAYIQNHSKLKVVISAAGVAKSTIKSYSTKILGVTYSGSTITSNTLKNSGTVPVVVTVTDSRGRTSTLTRNVSVTAYTEPKITAFTIKRCDKNGTLDDEGECIKYTYAFTVASLNNKNDSRFAVKYREIGTDDFTTIEGSSGAYSRNVTRVDTQTFDGNKSFEFSIEVSDYFHTVTHLVELETAFTLMDYHSSGRGMAVGKVAETADLFDVNLETRFRKSVEFSDNTFAFQPSAFNGEKGYTLLAVVTLSALNVNAPITFVINRRGALCPMTVYVRFASSSTSEDPDLASITYEGDNYGAFMVKDNTSTWKLYVDNTSGWSNPCLQEWFTTDNQRARLSVTFADEQIETLPTPYYRATPAKMQSILDYVYPVGSVYISYSHVSPADMFGGTWARISNAFLWATDASGTIGQTGGEKTHTLTVDELPSHSHGSVYSGTASGTKNTAWLSSGGSNMAYGALNAGGGQAHNNMPPYIQVSVWRRTA